MGFWVAFFYWLGTQVLAALTFNPKNENDRPSGLDEFQVPTATEGRVVPLIVGKVKVGGPNVIWYGDLATRAIKERAGGFLGIGGKDITKAYEYRIGVQMAIGSPIDGIDRVWMGDKVIASGETSSNIAVEDVGFFGGADAGGGIEFTLELELGDQTTANSYIASHQSPAPAYVNTSYVVLTDGAGGPGYIGNRPQLSNIAFEPYWYPNSLGVADNKHRIGDDANPICFLYELLVTNDDWGVQFQPSDVLVTGTAAEGALRALAEQIYDEGLGFSMVFDRSLEVRETIQEIERHVDGAFRLDLSDGRFKIILARPTETTPVNLNESNVRELVNYARGNWQETKNEVRIGYADRAKEYGPTFQPDYDNANRQITGRRAIATMNFPGVKTAAVSNKISAREIVSVAHPLAKATAIVRRELYVLQRGDPVTLTWPKQGLTDFPMRITRVRYGTDKSGEITLDLVEDVFRLETTGFADVPATLWEPPQTGAANPLDARIWEPPAQLRNTSQGFGLVLLIARDGGLQLDYSIHVDFDGGVDGFEATNEGLSDWTPVAELSAAVSADLDGPPHYTQSMTIEGLSDITAAQLDAIGAAAVSATQPDNILLVDDEVMWFEGATDGGGGVVTLTGVHRGAFGTVPVEHASEARVWFPSLGAGSLIGEESNQSFVQGQSIRVKAVTRTATGTLALASANPIPSGGDYTVAGITPYAPGDVQVSSRLFVDADWAKTPGTIRVTWKNRNRNSQAFSTEQDDAAVGIPGGTGITAIVRRVDTDAAVATGTFATNNQFNAAGFIPQSTPGEPDELDYYIELEAKAGSLSSQKWETQAFEVFGFGLDFGGDFGGQAESADNNLGVFLEQGAAPVIVDPIPTEPGQELVYHIDFLGVPAAGDGPRLLFNFFDRQASEFVNTDFVLLQSSYPTAEDMAEETRARIATTLADRPFTVSRAGSRVVISTSFGSVVLRLQHPNVAAAGVLPSWSVKQESLGSQTGRRQSAYLDFFDTEFDPITGQSIEVLSPSQGPEYQLPGTINISFRVVGLTQAARDDIASRTTQGGVGAAVSVQTVLDRYTGEMQPEMEQAINTSDYGDILQASLGRVTGAGVTQPRTALTLSVEQNYAVVESLYSSHGWTAPNGYKLLAKQSQAPIVGGPLPQVTRVGFNLAGGPSQVGNEYLLSVNGNVVSDTVTTSVADTIDALIADINGLSGYSAAYVAQLTTRISIDITGPNDTPFDVFAWIAAAGSSLRVEFQQIQE